ncbi:Beta-xylanase [Pleurostoma richardsiae]|uniref:Beta-xylanase n=1 Tax=Pleurostoma richardsiae TaxID=41990 RepID=A0AA38VLQ4_9PEZI|nr:Beta-xylanase [Pleurostoma richardsiae]
MRFPSFVAPLVVLPLVSAQLDYLAKKAGKLYFGTATDTSELSNTTYFKILTDTREFGQLTPSNGQKWEFVEPENGVFNFTEGEVVTDLAARTGQALRCHNLVWHSQLAPYVDASAWDRANLTAMLAEHVYREASHWRGRCYAWDVVNEGLNEDGTYRDDTFYRVLGEDYFLVAFREAARADPGARLYYNDYNIESPGPKAEGAKRIVRLVQDAGLRIDGVGLQSHFIVGSTPTIDEQIAAMEGYVALGVEVAQTELDIRIDLPVNASNLEQQKQDYKHSVGACMQVEKCVGTTVWDFYDPFSWVPGVFEGQGAATLYFDNFTKHPAYYGVVEALTNKTKCKKRGKRASRSTMSKPLFEGDAWN